MAAFPGRFTDDQLATLDIREVGYLLTEAEAINRQFMHHIGTAVRAGMSDKNGWIDFMKSLELDRSREQVMNDDREWIFALGRKK